MARLYDVEPNMYVKYSIYSVTHYVQTSAWAYLKVASSMTSIHYLWRSLSPFSLPCAQKWL